MEDTEPAKQVFKAETLGERLRDRPRLRWSGVKDARKLGVRNWMAAAKNRNAWRNRLVQAKTRNGL